MTFSDSIIGKLEPLFKSHGLKVCKESENILFVRSSKITIKFVYNEYESMRYFYISDESSDYDIEITNSMVKDIFGIEFHLPSSNNERYAKNLFLFFSGPAKLLLDGDRKLVKIIKEYSRKRNEEYNRNIIK